MKYLLTLLIAGAVAAFGYVYLVMDPDDPTRRAILGPLGLIDETVPRDFKSTSLDELRKTIADKSEAELKGLRWRLVTFEKAITECNRAELAKPPVSSPVFDEHVAPYLDNAAVVSGKVQDVEEAKKDGGYVARLKKEWGTEDSVCEHCNDSLFIFCTTCAAFEKKYNDALMELEKAKAAAAAAKEQAMAEKEEKQTQRKSSGGLMGPGGKRFTADKTKSSIRLGLKGNSRTPVGTTSSRKSAGDANMPQLPRRPKFCKACRNTQKMVCPACIKRAKPFMKKRQDVLYKETNALKEVVQQAENSKK